MRRTGWATGQSGAESPPAGGEELWTMVVYSRLISLNVLALHPPCYILYIIHHRSFVDLSPVCPLSSLRSIASFINVMSLTCNK